MEPDDDIVAPAPMTDKLCEILWPAAQPPDESPGAAEAHPRPKVTSQAIGQAVSEYLESEPEDTEASAAVAEYFQTESDSTWFDYRDEDDCR
ncbi:hypothetical protein [Nocardia sp. XZ_19_231]|uniref:hypothetical protein n=1 Tax=Nocardia sp. XZ_19_231 TaxID=2769252 RepID=UPI00188E47C6|nr:hypothetical protein [Nocardia sp. XZ_19_231]